jgi:hypothetical protein
MIRLTGFYKQIIKYIVRSFIDNWQKRQQIASFLNSGLFILPSSDHTLKNLLKQDYFFPGCIPEGWLPALFRRASRF